MNPTSPTHSSLGADSPHLLSVLNRKLFNQHNGNASSSEIQKEIEVIYQVACKLGGNSEFHFLREAGSSFNPKAARIPIVLLTAYPKAETEEIALAILSSLILLAKPKTCIEGASSSTSNSEGNYTGMYVEKYARQYCHLLSVYEQIKELSLQAGQNEDFSCINEISDNPTEMRVLTSMFIDKIRHLHLITAPNFTDILHQASLEAVLYSRLAHSALPFYEAHIKHWRNNYQLGRFSQKN